MNVWLTYETESGGLVRPPSRESKTMAVQKSRTTEIETGGVRDLQLVVELRYPDGCPLSNVDERICDLVVRKRDGCCKVDFLVESADSRQNRKIRRQTADSEAEECGNSGCICDRFERRDCLPHFTDVRDGAVVVTTYPPSREGASELLSDLEDRCPSIQLLRLRESNGEVGGDLAEVDLSNLTPKQRDAIVTAHEAGFFDQGSGPTLEELAAEQGISAAAYSQRLTRAKSELFGQMFGPP